MYITQYFSVLIYWIVSYPALCLFTLNFFFFISAIFSYEINFYTDAQNLYFLKTRYNKFSSSKSFLAIFSKTFAIIVKQFACNIFRKLDTWNSLCKSAFRRSISQIILLFFLLYFCWHFLKITSSKMSHYLWFHIQIIRTVKDIYNKIF